MEKIYQHFNPSEHRFIDQMASLKLRAQEQYTMQLTPFLNPREQYILSYLVRDDEEVSLYFYDDVERTRAIFSVFEPEKQDFEIVLLEIKYASKFHSLSHSKVLGALLGTGIKRELIGDIISDGERYQVFINQKIAPFMIDNISKMGSTPVTLIETEDVIQNVNENSVIEQQLLRSMRLDAVIASFFNVSRQTAKALVENGHVTCNWKEVKKCDYTVQIFDTISIRKYGRMMLMEDLGDTKKGKRKIVAKLFKNRK